MERFGRLPPTSIPNHRNYCFNAGYLQFGIKEKMVATSTVPIDKFSDKNIERTVEFVNYIQRLNPSRVKFGDEKHLKGKEMFDRKVRKCPVTGKVEEVVVDSDFRNTYNIVGFCGIDLEAIPMDYYISDDTNDAETICEWVEQSVAKGFLRRGDTLVLDNASIHSGSNYHQSANNDGDSCIVYEVSPELAGQMTPIRAAPAAAGHTQKEDAANMHLGLYHQQQEESGDMPYLPDSPFPDSPNLSQSTAGGIASSVENSDMPYLPGSPLPDSPNLSQSTAGGTASSVENSGSQDTTGIVA
jgi:hypothetical protein